MQKYQILDIIDQGAYGIVWKALNKQTQQFVAIKQFKESDEEEDNKRTIQREIKMLKMLKGDYVVGIREAFKKKGKIYLIFQYFPKNLLNIIENYSDGLAAQLIKCVIHKIVKCLKFLHSKNIIHRDIKPQNILLNQNNQTLKLCDLGFARFIPQNSKSMTEYVATRWYRSPQLLVGQPYGKPSDIFALGCIIGELVDGQPMFPGEDQIDQIFLLKKYVGELTSNQHKCLFQNHKFSGAQIPHAIKKQTLDERYIGKIQRNALLFMKSCLKMNPAQRLTAEQALKHPFLIQLSTFDNEFQNDEQNLLKDDRKTVPKLQNRSSVASLVKYQQYHKQIQESIIIPKKKSFSKKQENLKTNYGSVDYSSLKRQSYNGSLLTNKPSLHKKSSHQTLIKGKQGPQVTSKLKKIVKEGLKKNMSQQKHLKVNLDVNVNINFKINKKTDKNFNLNSGKAIDSQKDGKLPELKNSSKGFFMKNNGGLISIARRQFQSNLSIYGHSKEMSQQLLNKKLGNYIQ